MPNAYPLEFRRDVVQVARNRPAGSLLTYPKLLLDICFSFCRVLIAADFACDERAMKEEH